MWDFERAFQNSKLCFKKFDYLPQFDHNNTVLEAAAGIHLFKVNNGNSRTRCEICLKIKIKATERR